MQVDPRGLLSHIRQAGADIESFTEGMDTSADTTDSLNPLGVGWVPA